MTQKENETLIDFEQQIQWRWSCGDANGYKDALADDVTYVDPLAGQFLHGREAVAAHFSRILPAGTKTDVIHQEYHKETARALSDDEVLLVFNFTTYSKDDKGGEKLFLSWNMSLIFRKTDDRWLLTHGHLSLRNAFDLESIPRLQEIWKKGYTE
ncbi:MAG: SgcJ/EcaC family oxidoreductase [Bacteroidales bacterium]|nr:SgcJ/EcaC family oxidoreductase [Bacteroidales bacterium]